MKAKRFVITSGNSPLTIPTDYRSGPISIITNPSGAGNYTVAFTTTPIQDTSLTPSYIDITSMTAATTIQSEETGSITALRVTLNSGTDVTLDLAQSNV